MQGTKHKIPNPDKLRSLAGLARQTDDDLKRKSRAKKLESLFEYWLSTLPKKTNKAAKKGETEIELSFSELDSDPDDTNVAFQLADKLEYEFKKRGFNAFIIMLPCPERKTLTISWWRRLI